MSSEKSNSGIKDSNKEELLPSYAYMKNVRRETESNVVTQSDLSRYSPKVKGSSSDNNKRVNLLADELIDKQETKNTWDARFDSLFAGADEFEANYKKPNRSVKVFVGMLMIIVGLAVLSIMFTQYLSDISVNNERYVDWDTVEFYSNESGDTS